jgi:hypothetical protein
MASTPFFGEPGEQHPDGGHVLFDCGRRGQALERFDVGGHRDGFNVFKLLIPGTLRPCQELLDRPIISGSGVAVANRDRKEFEELFAGGWPGARDESWSCERIDTTRHLPDYHGSLPVALRRNRPLEGDYRRGDLTR